LYRVLLRTLLRHSYPIEEFDKLYDAAHKRENVIRKSGRRRVLLNHVKVASKFDFGVYSDEENVQVMGFVAVLKNMAEGW
jgi:hypothetical protein